MDDFSVHGNTFDNYVANLEKVLYRCEEVGLVLNCEKCNFMVQSGVVWAMLCRIETSKWIELRLR